MIPMVAGHSEDEHAAAVDVANEEGVDGGKRLQMTPISSMDLNGDLKARPGTRRFI